MNFLPRTDLAVEDMENENNDSFFKEEKDGILIEKVVLDAALAKKLKKKQGVYYTITTDVIKDLAHDKCSDISYKISDILEEIYDEFNLDQSSYVLILGLGNDEVTPDSLGPKVMKNLLVTKHLADLNQLEEGLGIVGAIAPGVMGQTGIESSDIIKALVKDTKPDLVIVVDALASRSLHRVNRTIQITTGGISPGSGVGNKRKEISKETMGVPVIAIGVPTVVDIASIFYDLNKMIGEEDFDLSSMLIESDLNYMVTNKEIDEMINMTSDIISKGLNISIHNLEIYE